MREPDDNLETFGAIVLVVLLVLAILVAAPLAIVIRFLEVSA
jgi:hypothetical protein